MWGHFYFAQWGHYHFGTTLAIYICNFQPAQLQFPGSLINLIIVGFDISLEYSVITGMKFL